MMSFCADESNADGILIVGESRGTALESGDKKRFPPRPVEAPLRRDPKTPTSSPEAEHRGRARSVGPSVQLCTGCAARVLSHLQCYNTASIRLFPCRKAQAVMPCKLEAAFGSATVDLEPWLLPFALRRFKTALQPFMLRRPCMLRRESYKELCRPRRPAHAWAGGSLMSMCCQLGMTCLIFRATQGQASCSALRAKGEFECICAIAVHVLSNMVSKLEKPAVAACSLLSAPIRRSFSVGTTRNLFEHEGSEHASCWPNSACRYA